MKSISNEEKIKRLKEYKRALYNIDMVQGFVNFGAMSNKDYNKLVPEQIKLMDDFVSTGDSVNMIGEGHSKDAQEFESYPEHCVLGTPEADFIPEFDGYLYLPDTRIYRKNSINGMFNEQLRQDIIKMSGLQEAVFCGVCEDLCVMDFVRSYARFMDEINRRVKLFVVGNAVDTFDAPGHNRDEWKKIARMVMEQAGVCYVDSFEELKEKEKTLVYGGR